jgi:cell wall-associated NlpC family hydrolase
VKSALREQATDSYIHTGQQSVVMVKPGVDPAVQRAYVSSLTAGQNDALDQMRSVRMQLAEQQAQLNAAQKQANDALAKVQSAQRSAAKASADEQAVLAKVKGDLTGLVAAQQAQQEAAAAAKAQAAIASRAARPAASRSASPAATSAPAASTPVAPGASGAVEEARRQIGKPYRYGGAGPDSFDCSGLTAWAWGHAGHSLPHSSQAQYSSLPHVPLSDLQPGDLVFFGSDIHHEGIYVGGGTMIEAPHTGLNVRYASIYRSDLVGAARP